MPFPTYDVATETANGTVSESKLHEEIVAAGPYTTTFQGLKTDGAQLAVLFEAPPSAANQTTVDNTVAAHTGVDKFRAPPSIELQSPDGTVWNIVVDDAGNVSAAKKA